MKKIAIVLVIIAALLAGAWYGTFSLRSQKANAYLESGNKYLADFNDKQAILEYKKGAFLYPSADIYFALGQSYFLNQNYSTAEYYFKKALKKDNNHINANFGLSETYLFQEKYPEAEQLLADKNSQAELISVQLARIYLAQAQNEKAQKALENQNDNLAKFYQAKLLLFQEQFQDAAQKLTEIEPKDNRTRTMLLLPPDQSEIDVLNQAANQMQKVSNPDSQKVILGEALNQTNDAVIALPILKKVAEKNPTYRDAQVFLGHSYILIKKYETAKDILLKAKELDPVFYPTWLYLSQTYKGLGDEVLANTCYDKAKKLR